MRKRYSLVIALCCVCVSCFVIFVFGGYFYLKTSVKYTENSVSNEPYSFAPPENCGVLFDFLGEKVLVFLDFESNHLSLIFPPEEYREGDIYGYNVDRTVRGTYSILADIIDGAGGVTLEYNGEKLLYTGIQTIELLSETVDSYELKHQIATSLLFKIGEDGINSELTERLVKSCETDITVPDVMLWEKYIKELCKNGRIVN